MSEELLREYTYSFGGVVRLLSDSHRGLVVSVGNGQYAVEYDLNGNPDGNLLADYARLKRFVIDPLVEGDYWGDLGFTQEDANGIMSEVAQLVGLAIPVEVDASVFVT